MAASKHLSQRAFNEAVIAKRFVGLPTMASCSALGRVVEEAMYRTHNAAPYAGENLDRWGV